MRRVALTWLIGFLSYVFWKMYNRRMLFRRLRAQAWSAASGHLHLLPPELAKLPKDAAQEYPFVALAEDFPDTDNLYCLDLWPFFKPLMVVTSPEIAIQACQGYDLPKPDSLKTFFAPISGGEGMFVSNGSEWKRHRALFNPGFSAKAILEHIPRIIQEAEAYIDIIRDHAEKGDIFFLDKLTCSYMMDVIGAVTLQKMSSYISTELNKAYEEWNNPDAATRTSKSVMNLAIAGYMDGKKAAATLDPQFKKWAIIQMREFLFVGHDPTAATIVYCLYLLSKDPSAMQKMRDEHDAIFGTNFAAAPTLLKLKPQVLNQLPFTVAVIKEALRLFPPASGLREGLPGVPLRDSKRNQYPTEGVSIWILHLAIQRNPRSWVQPDAFLPERWLAKPGDALYPPHGGWRQFGEFDIRDTYDEFDRREGEKGIKTVKDERVYQISQGSAYPADGFPCRASLRRT
ncbi:cytochrome P450 [Clohesyomyces aquaticus]|uniref:Cytochrome P450 n=1 Tax=Clohesyomyces aquaticus TaxID=1231657 RepID=A0A1Y1YF55_9PLEO|nr:cytochrome P450 [Clohesyomyces aquaticus]